MITKTYTAAVQEAGLSLAAAGAMSSEPDGRLRAEHHRAQALAWLEYARELRLSGIGREEPAPRGKATAMETAQAAAPRPTPAGRG